MSVKEKVGAQYEIYYFIIDFIVTEKLIVNCVQNAFMQFDKSRITESII